MRRLELRSFELQDGLPPEMANLANLEWLRLHGSFVGGGIPPVLTRMPSLRTVELGNTGLTGAIPASLGEISTLEELELGPNQLTGSIPPELGNLRELRSLNLRANQLSGELPPALASLENLRTLDISDNQLTGEIPVDLDRTLSTVKELRLENNDFSGCISDALHDLNYTGDPGVPACDGTHQGDLQAILAIHKALGSPNFTGWLGRDPYHTWSGVSTDREGRMVKLNLEGAVRYGGRERPVPEEIRDLEKLQSLNLGENLLSGTIPEFLGDLTDLRELRLDKNLLTGDIPASFANLKELRALILRANDLSVSLPGVLESLPKLEEIMLSENDFTGCVTEELAKRINLGDQDWREGPFPCPSHPCRS